MSRLRAGSWEEAEALSAAGQWAEAGSAWEKLAEKTLRRGDAGRAREAASRGADAYRRDDRPATTAKLLRTYAGDTPRSAVDDVQLAAVLMEAGEVRAAADIAQQSLERAVEPADRALALDTLAGLRLAAGDVAGSREAVAAVAALGLPGAEVARRFRQAQLDRLDGALGAAERSWFDLARQLEPHSQARGPEAACHSELGELMLLRVALGAPRGVMVARSLDALSKASRGWQEAGRRSSFFRTQAWIARARAVGGETMMPGVIDTALRYAGERQLRLLEADLLLCRAVVAQRVADAEAALSRLDDAPLARGRARVVLLELGGRTVVERMFEELSDDAPWTARAMIVVGRRHQDAAMLADGEARAAAMLA